MRPTPVAGTPVRSPPPRPMPQWWYLLAAAAKAELSGALADQLQTALDSRGLIERAKGALMERERLDDQEAFTHLRRAARSSGRKLTDVAAEVAAGKPLPRGRTAMPMAADSTNSAQPADLAAARIVSEDDART